jgi:hypothetical protein
MAFIIPIASDVMTQDWDTSTYKNLAFSEGQPATRNTKAAGGLPISGPTATAFVNTTSSSPTGAIKGTYWDFEATQAGHNVSVNTQIAAFCFQFNAPNRIQCATKVNNGIVFRAFSGASPTNYKTWQIGGNNSVLGQAQGGNAYVIIDLNDLGNDAEVGTYNNTDVRGWGFGTVRFNLAATSSTQYFFSRFFIFDTVKNGAKIPRFTGASDWDDVIFAQDGTDFSTKITNLYQQLGRTFSITTPFEFGDGSDTGTFSDGGDTVVSPGNNIAGDHRTRLTNQAMRVYNRTNFTTILSGAYFWGTAADWDFEDGTSTLSGVFSGMGDFILGALTTATGVFTLASGKKVIVNSTADIDGITVNGDVELNSANHLTDVTINGDLRISTGANSTLVFDNVKVTGNIYNDSGSNTLTITSTNGSTITTTETGTGNGQVNITSSATLTIEVSETGADIVILAAGTSTVLGSIDAQAGTDFDYIYSVNQSIDIGVIKQGFIVTYRYGYVLTGINATFPVTLLVDRSYV